MIQTTLHYSTLLYITLARLPLYFYLQPNYHYYGSLLLLLVFLAPVCDHRSSFGRRHACHALPMVYLFTLVILFLPIPSCSVLFPPWLPRLTAEVPLSVLSPLTVIARKALSRCLYILPAPVFAASTVVVPITPSLRTVNPVLWLFIVPA